MCSRQCVRSFLLFVALFFAVAGPVSGQADSVGTYIDEESIQTITSRSKRLSIDLGIKEEVDLVLSKVHNYRYLESITFEGEASERDLRKILFRIAVLKNVTSLTFNDNELLKMPENISMLKGLQSLTIAGSTNLDFTDLCVKLRGTQVKQLQLIDNDLKQVPATLGDLVTLRKVKISGSNQMDYTELVEQLAKIPGLNTLAIPLNYITDLPRNISSLRALQVLDVSNNDLIEIPAEASGLKTINNLSIQGNLLLDPVKDLEKLKGNNIRYLAIDKEISGEELEQIKRLFPEAQVDFPLAKENEDKADTSERAVTAPEPPRSGRLKVKKETTVLSNAYLSYPAFFQGLTYNFDTLRFEERHLDLRYENTTRIVRNIPRRPPPLYMRDNCVNYERPGKKDEIWFRFATDDRRLVANFPELRAFGGMYWVYKGDLNKKQFRRMFLRRRYRPAYLTTSGKKPRKRSMPILWNDVRVTMQQNNNLFTVTLKSDTGFVSFTAYPLFNDMPVEKSRITYDRRILLYWKSLSRRSQRFNSSLARARRAYDQSYRSLVDYAWKEMQSRMSNEEKTMKREDWLNYYDELIANERDALDKTSLGAGYIYRSLSLRGFDVAAPGTQNISGPNVPFGTKNFNADFVDGEGSGRLAVNNILVVDVRNKKVEQYPGTLGLAPDVFYATQFASQSLLVQLRSGNWGYVSAAELDRQNFEPNRVYQLKARVFDRNLNTIGELLDEVLK